MNTGSALARFTITLSTAVNEPVQVEWHTSDGTAKATVDYTANKGTVVFAPGEKAKTVDILVYGRAVGTEDRSFFVEMLPPTNAILGASIGECIITVDTSGSTPVTQIIVPTGPVGPNGKSAYQSYLDTTTDNPPKTEAEWVESLKGDPAEIALEVTPLIDVGSTVLTAQGTETLAHPDSTTVKAVARRVAYAQAAKIATVTLADGDNSVGQSDMAGDVLDMSSPGLYPRIMRGSTVLSPDWSVQPNNKLLIKSAVAGDLLYVCQYDVLSAKNKNTNTRELWRRELAEAGLTLVSGSFEDGATLNSSTDAIWHVAGAQCYVWKGVFPKTVEINSNPAGTGGIDSTHWESTSQHLLINLLATEKGAQILGYKNQATGSVLRTQSSKNAEFLSVQDFGAIGDGADHPLSEKFTTLTAAQMVYPFVTSLTQTQDFAGFQAAINAAAKSGGRGAGVYVPATDGMYMVDGVNINSAVTLYGDGKYGAKIKNRSGTCITLKARFAAVKGLNFEGGGKDSGNTTAVRIREALVTVTGNSFAFFDVCVMAESGYLSAELIINDNRFAASNYGVFLGGGQINSHISHNTYADNYTHIHVNEDLTIGISGTTEGLVFSKELLYAGGKDSAGRRAIEVTGTRWTWFDNCMSDLSGGIAAYFEDAKDVKISMGYYSSNHSVGSPCIKVVGACQNFLIEGTCISDSRSFGIDITKKGTDFPKNCRLIGVTIQHNDIDPSQNGDIIINSVPDVTLIGCNLDSNKTGSISIIDNLGGGSSVYLDRCPVVGDAYVAPGCKLKNINSPTHPEEQTGIATIPGGSNTVSIPLTIKPLKSGVGIAVNATPASGGDLITAGVQGNNIVINRSSSPAGSTAVSFKAFTI